jgi:hypothetical protein
VWFVGEIGAVAREGGGRARYNVRTVRGEEGKGVAEWQRGERGGGGGGGVRGQMLAMRTGRGREVLLSTPALV